MPFIYQGLYTFYVPRLLYLPYKSGYMEDIPACYMYIKGTPVGYVKGIPVWVNRGHICLVTWKAYQYSYIEAIPVWFHGMHTSLCRRKAHLLVHGRHISLVTVHRKYTSLGITRKIHQFGSIEGIIIWVHGSYTSPVRWKAYQSGCTYGGCTSLLTWRA
jgi:hypothetical protein